MSFNAIRRRGLLLLLGVLLINGCDGGQRAGDGVDARPSFQTVTSFPSSIPAGHRFIINRYTNRLAVFDEKQNRVILEDERGQNFVYAMPDPGNELVTIGDSKDDGYAIATLGDRKINSILTASDNEGIFPLASLNNVSVFSVASYDAGGKIQSTSIRELRNGRLSEGTPTSQPVVAGTLISDRLWFTSFDQTAQSFTLNSMAVSDLDRGNARVEKTGLTEGRLFSYDNKVIANGVFSSGGKNIRCEVYCFVDHGNSRLINLETADEGSLRVSAFSLKSGEYRPVVTGDIVDIELVPDGLLIYMKNGLKRIGNEQLP